MKYTPIIGLEVHVELKTRSKMFCSCSADYFGKQPNTHTCPVCLGLPGALPVPNKQAIDWCIMIGLALNCNVNNFSKFDRKNYFYPDLSKGFQTSQYDLPFSEKGHITLSSGKNIGITRVHMEEDTAKLTHQLEMSNDKIQISKEKGISLIDFNRSGVPLVEIVTEPDFNDALEVKEYLQKLQQIIRYLGVSDADMEKGEMRLEPNISLQSDEEKANKAFPKYKVEVKNINSFRFVEKAINYELKRQQEILEKGHLPAQETRGWNENRQVTFSQRLKEAANDYRYFPEPDIPPIRITQSQIENIKSQMPELPNEKQARFVKDYKIPDYDAEILTREITTADYFESAVEKGKIQTVSPKQIANAIINKKVDINSTKVDKLISQIKGSQTVQVDESKLEQVIEEVLKEQPKAVEDYKNGKETVIMFLVGQVMRKLAVKADATMIRKRLEMELKK